MAETLVEPKNPMNAAPVVESTAPGPASSGAQTESAPSLPPELIQIPAIQALVVGQPPAVSASIEDFATRPEGKLITENKDSLFKAGMGLYRSLSGDTGVLFNRFFVHDKDLVDADKAGKLTQIAPSFDEVNMLVGKAGPDHPALAANSATPETFKGPPAGLPPQVAPNPSPAMPAEPAKMQAAQTKNLNAGSPTSGPKPGAGRILNNILKPVI